jgi:hypothetical protein
MVSSPWQGGCECERIGILPLIQLTHRVLLAGD